MDMTGMMAARTRLLSAVDGAPLGSTFPSEASKERYETLLAFAFRRLEAACYHAENIQRELNTTVPPPRTAPASPPAGGRTGEARTRVVRSASSYYHELSAFVVALKGALDFIAQLAIDFHFVGEGGDSVRQLLRRVDRGEASVLDVVTSRHSTWILQLREYRHHLVHRLAPTTVVCEEGIERGGKSVRAVAPVVVPSETPEYVPDTRLTAVQEEEVPPGLMRMEGHAVFTEGASSSVVRLTLEYRVAPGYVQIEEFCKDHLARCSAFMSEFLDACAATGFTRISKKH